MTPSIVVGEIDRISGSGNGMLRADGEEYNLGPLDKSAVGNTAVAVPMTGTWAVCLTPYDDPGAYLSRFFSTAGIDEAEVEQQVREMKNLQMDSVGDFLVRDDDIHDITDFAAGDTIEVEVTIAISDRSYVIFEDGTVIEVADTYLPAGENTTLELVEVNDLISEAKLSPAVLERAPEPGAELMVTVQEKNGSTGYAIRDGVPIVLPNCAGAKGDELRVGVESLESNGVKATVAALPVESRPKVDDTLDLDVYFSERDTQAVQIIDGIPLEISQPTGSITGTVPITIAEVEGNTVFAHIDYASYRKAPELGTELNVTIERKTGSTGYSSQDGVPIVLPECFASEGDSLRVVATEYLDTGVEASMAALPTEARPDVGDVLTLEIELPAHNSTTVLIHDGIPIEITQPVLSMEGTLPIEILELRANGVTGCVDLAAYSGLSKGDQLLLEGPAHYDDQLLGKQDETPIIVPLTESIPSAPDSLPATVTEIRADVVYASISNRPEIRVLHEGTAITVNTTGRTDQYLVAEYNDYPVWVSWPFDETERPPTLTVEVSEVTECGLFASPPVLPDTGFSRRNEVIPARVETIHSDHISVSIVEPIEGEPYVLPAIIPISFDVSGEIGIEVVGQENSHLIGIVRTLETGENASLVPVYLREIQETLLAIRDQQFEAATGSAREAADATETVARRAEALRFQIFASGEATLSTDGSDEQILDEIADLSKKVRSMDLSETYRGLIDTELEIYEELLSVGANKAPDSIKGLQRIAYNVDTRARVEGIAGRIWKDLLKTSDEVELDEWTSKFPHRLLVFRVAQICTQFEYPPETASKLVDQYPSIERLQWRIAPESNPEPSPDETASVVPQTFERSSVADESSERDTIEASDDGLTDSNSSGATDAVADDEPLSGQPTETTAENTEAPDRRSEGQQVTDVETDTSTTAETIDSTRESVDDSERAEPAQTDAADVTDVNEKTRGSTNIDINSTTSPTPSTATSQLRALRAEAEAAASDDPIRDTSPTGGGSRYQRAPAIKEYVQARADGVCEACGEPAPFETPDGRPYLETHHVDELGQGGEDHPDKVAAVCPTCHKRIHYGADGDALNEILRERLDDGLADVGVE